MDLKPLAFVGNAREQLRAFPVDARRRAGFEKDRELGRARLGELLAERRRDKQ